MAVRKFAKCLCSKYPKQNAVLPIWADFQPGSNPKSSPFTVCLLSGGIPQKVLPTFDKFFPVYLSLGDCKICKKFTFQDGILRVDQERAKITARWGRLVVISCRQLTGVWNAQNLESFRSFLGDKELFGHPKIVP